MTTPPSHNRVAVFRDAELTYPVSAPHHPPEHFPEYPFKESTRVDPSNSVYSAVRTTLKLLGLDAQNSDTARWNPLGDVIRPGDSVLIKPNLVRHYHGDGGSLDSLVTHSSIVRAVLDFVCVALHGEGKVIIGDAPLQECDWESLMKTTGLSTIVEFCGEQSGLDIRLVDFREERATRGRWGRVSRGDQTGREPGRNVAVDLGGTSLLAEVQEFFEHFRVTNYDPQKMTVHHNVIRHEYLVAREALDADVIINLPKLKTHRKAGMTCCLKNMVGINGSKDWLPHHRNRSVEEGGDQYTHPSLRKRAMSRLLDVMESGTVPPLAWHLLNLLRRGLWETGRHPPFRFRDPYFEGSWHGNDTIWRTVLDLNRIVFFGNSEGTVADEGKPKRYFALSDAVVGGEGEGPLRPTPKHCGVLVAGFHPVAVDAVCCDLMGFDPQAIPVIREAMGRQVLGHVDWNTESNYWFDENDLRRRNLGFQPCSGWIGHIETDRGSHEDRAPGVTLSFETSNAGGAYDDG